MFAPLHVHLFFFSPPDKVPHFSRLGDVEVNAGQNASFQCVATGKVSESEPFLLEVRRRWGAAVPGTVSS